MREFVVSAYFDYCTLLVTRKKFVKKVCHRYGQRTELWRCFYFRDTDYFILLRLLFSLMRFRIIFYVFLYILSCFLIN